MEEQHPAHLNHLVLGQCLVATEVVGSERDSKMEPLAVSFALMVSATMLRMEPMVLAVQTALVTLVFESRLAVLAVSELMLVVSVESVALVVLV